jgi:diguanylate cyclase (GGDEF)-like protein
LFFGWRATLIHQAIATVIIVTALGWRDPSLIGPGLVVAGTGVAVAWVVGTLVRLARRSLVDESTGLLNRRGLERALDERLDGDEPLTIAVLDLDGFAAINHSAGRAAGDAVLRDFARGLAQECPAPIQVGRSGGDEFVMLLPGVQEHQVLALTQRLRRRTGVAFCAGITVLHPDDSPSTLLARADTALYQAKRSGGNRDQVRSEQGSHLARRLRSAITEAQICVHYQPIVDLNDANRVVGVEALARWYTGTTEVSPALFVPVAEEEGLIVDLGRLVLRRALGDVGRLRAALGPELFVSVNVSGKELVEPMFVTGVTRALSDFEVGPDALLLEVTESTLDAQTPVAAGALRRLRAEGVRIAIDDFGTGYSSLSRLDALPVDLLKLDGGFISDTSAAPTALLRAVTALGDALGLPIVAECVARETSEELVRDVGIHLAQGWLYSPALPIDDLLERLPGSSPAVNA